MVSAKVMNIIPAFAYESSFKIHHKQHWMKTIGEPPPETDQVMSNQPVAPGTLETTLRCQPLSSGRRRQTATRK
jgi:hypothetical protein